MYLILAFLNLYTNISFILHYTLWRTHFWECVIFSWDWFHRGLVFEG